MKKNKTIIIISVALLIIIIFIIITIIKMIQNTEVHNQKIAGKEERYLASSTSGTFQIDYDINFKDNTNKILLYVESSSNTETPYRWNADNIERCILL